jgi:hypothetical protein
MMSAMIEPLELLGPLAALVGVWEGDKGDDIAPSDDRGTENNKFRERIVLKPISPVDNHEQKLYGLSHSRVAWRVGEDKPFHDEVGYWLWDPKARQVLRCFIIPRGVTVLAGGTVEPNAKSFTLQAAVGSDTYGICSNKFLDVEFKTEVYEVKVTIHGTHSFSYEEDTQLRMKGAASLFHHRDRNTLFRAPVNPGE